MAELLSIMKESGKNFVSYISDLLSRCKLQKSLLHCLLASVYNQGRSAPISVVNNNSSKAADTAKLTEMIIDFNENSLDPSVSDTFQMKLLQLMLVMIMLEDQIRLAQGASDAGSAAGERAHLTVSIVFSCSKLTFCPEYIFPIFIFSSCDQGSDCSRIYLKLIKSYPPFTLHEVLSEVLILSVHFAM